MSKRIEHLADSPCYKCGKIEQCEAKIARNPVLSDIVDCVMPRADFEYERCSIWKAIKMEEDDEQGDG